VRARAITEEELWLREPEEQAAAGKKPEYLKQPGSPAWSCDPLEFVRTLLEQSLA